jgi:hypothetical protein
MYDGGYQLLVANPIDPYIGVPGTRSSAAWRKPRELYDLDMVRDTFGAILPQNRTRTPTVAYCAPPQASLTSPNTPDRW